ncbi:MAG: EamA family transporter [Acidobacteriia bacterium]|nr:EamA family transporter [Terriglobia bacterium]
MATLEAVALHPRERTAPSRLTMALAFFVIYVVWGTTYLAIRYAVETIPPLVTAAVRHTTAGAILMGIAWSRGFRPRREHWIAGSVVGTLFFLIGHGSLHWAEKYVSSGLAALLVASEPLWILLIGAAMRQQKLNWLNGLGLLLGLAGVTILTLPELTAWTSLTWAVVAVLAGAASWAIGVCISPRLRLPADAVGRAAVPVVCGGAMLLIAAGVSGEFSAVHWSVVSVRSLLGLGYLIVFGSVVAFTAYTWLLQRCSPTLVATHTFVNPLVAVLVGWLWAAEPLSTRIVIATAVILGAIVLVQRGDRHAEMQAEAVQSD